MQVKQIMTREIATCRPDTNLAIVAKLMWDRDCGFVPVVDASLWSASEFRGASPRNHA